MTSSPTLVTGATGLVGNNVVRQLLGRGRGVRVLARDGADPRPLAGLDVEIFRGDILRPETLSPACSGAGAGLPPSSAQSATSRAIRSSARARTPASGLLMESPRGATSSQCSPLTARPWSAAMRRHCPACAAVMADGSSASVKGATSRP